MEYEYIGLGYHHNEVGGGTYQRQQQQQQDSTGINRNVSIPVVTTINQTTGGFVRANPGEQTCNLPRTPTVPPIADSTDYGRRQLQLQQQQQQHPPLRKHPPSQLTPQKLSVINQRREQQETQIAAVHQHDDDESSNKIAASTVTAAGDPMTTTTAAAATDAAAVASSNSNEAVEAARLRAMDVISKFQQQQKQQEENHNLGTGELGQKRKQFLEKFHEQKIRLAMIKNLEYVARVEDERLQARLLLQEQAEQYHMQLEDYHNQVLLSRQQQQQQQRQQQQNLSSSSSQTAGIGTQQRITQERKTRKQQRHLPNNSNQDSSVAIYVSNLPTDGSASDELMRALFGSYGNLRKIHFYYDKKTGNLKGDALVIYNLDNDNNSDDGGGGGSGRRNEDNKSELIDTVCCQMNGAELPCGTALKVEPSDPLYAIRKKRQQAIQYGQISDDAVTMETEEAEMKGKTTMKSEVDHRHDQNKHDGEINEPVANKSNDDDDDDLDDFFASL